MSKQTSQPTRTGPLAGAKVKIGGVYNKAGREYVPLVNAGNVAQPLGGWVLASLRGPQFFLFPDEALLWPGRVITVHSGPGALHHPPDDLLWTPEPRWNNRGDVAVLFDANGLEVERYAYPHRRVLGSAAQRRLCLVPDGETWHLVEETVHPTDAGIRARRASTH